MMYHDAELYKNIPNIQHSLYSKQGVVRDFKRMGGNMYMEYLALCML